MILINIKKNKKRKIIKKYIKYELKNYFSFIFFLFSYYLYFLSLEKCKNGYDNCSLKFKWIKSKLNQAIYSSLILSILLEAIILNIISKIHLIHLIIIFLLFLLYSHGNEFENHGLFNFIGCFIIIILILFILIPMNFFIYLIKKKKIYIIIYTTILSIQITIIYYYIHPYINCNEWEKGLNNTFIENNIKKYGCQIKFPKFCLYKIGKYFLDITKNFNFECGKKDTKKLILKNSKSLYINKTTKRIGFPLTNKDPIYFKDYPQEFFVGKGKFFHYVMNNLIDMDNKEQIDKLKGNIPEIIIDYTKNPFGEMSVNLNFNKTLSEKRKKMKLNSNPYSDNLIILYIDSVSRNNALRQLKSTTKFFKKFLPFHGAFNKKYPNENFHSFEFFKYHSFLGHTANNYPKLFYGRNRGKNIIRITKYMKDLGYVTCFSNADCQRDSIRSLHNFSDKEICDHEMIICDPNMMSLTTNKKRCLYNKLTSAYQYDYGNQFFRKYKKNRKFLSILNNSGHEGTLESLKYEDEIIYKFLINLFNDNLLKDTSIILMSDHGVVLPSIYYFVDFYQIEASLPMLFMIINDKKNCTYSEQYNYIYQNQQTFITAYDIYNTILNLIYGKAYNSFNKTTLYHIPKSPFGSSLFLKINQKSRNPLKYSGMEKSICIIK